jgi:hypothetical protein
MASSQFSKCVGNTASKIECVPNSFYTPLECRFDNAVMKRIKVTEIPHTVWKTVGAEIATFSTGMMLNKTFIGSGSFISWDGKFGILTAEHVVNHPHSAELSLDYSGKRTQVLQLAIAEYPHVLAMPVKCLSGISLGNRTTDEHGPDLSVIILPQCPQLDSIRAKKSFWPLDVRTNVKIERALVNQGVVCFCGHPAERLGKPGPVGAFPDAQYTPGLAGITQQVSYYEKNGFDYVEAKSVRGTTSGALSSYGGMSGGGFWRVPIYQTSGGDNAELQTGLWLLGTVFWQGPELDGYRVLRAHGPKTIYQVLLRKLRQAI